MRAAGVRYGALGLPLAFVALPLYVLLPHHYAERFGLPLAVLGGLLLAVRGLDAVLDPLIGRAVDRRLARGARAAWRTLGWVALVLGLGFLAVFFPPFSAQAGAAGAASAGPLLAWCAAALVLTYLAYSAATVLHQAWGARLGGGDAGQSAWVAWREGAALLGVLMASVLPSLAGLPAMTGVFLASLLLGWWLLVRGPLPVGVEPAAAPGGAPPVATHADASLWAPWHSPAFRRLLAVFMLNGIASAVPATLLLFFVRDRLQAPEWEGALLGAYFACGALSLPLWVRLVRRWGLSRCWMLGMALSLLAFSGASRLGAGDAASFLLICMASGLTLGADLAMPGALLVRVVRHDRQTGAAEGAYFGWWNSATKLNLALAAGLALPALQWAGYEPGTRDPHGLQMLAWAYGLLPCGLKLLALAALWRWRSWWDSEGEPA